MASFVLEIRWRLRLRDANLPPYENLFGELTRYYETPTRCPYTEQNNRTHEGVHVHTFCQKYSNFTIQLANFSTKMADEVHVVMYFENRNEIGMLP